MPRAPVRTPVRAPVSRLAAYPLLLALAAWTAPAAAAEVTPQGAAAIAQAIQASLDKLKPGEDKEFALKWDGPVRAEPEAGHYAVRLPGLSVTGEDGSHVDIGVVRLTLTPQGEDFAVEAVVPNGIAAFDDEDNRQADLTIASQHLTGVWSPRFQTLLATDASLGGIELVPTDNTGRLRIGGVALTTRLTESSPKRWDGPGALTITDVAFSGGPEGQTLNLQALEAGSAVSGLDLERYARMTAELQDLAQAQGNAPPDAAKLRREIDEFRDLLGGAAVAVRVRGVAVKDPSQGIEATLDEAGYSVKLDGLQSGQSSFSMGYGHKGLRFAPNPIGPDFTPEAVQIDLSLAKLPNQPLWQVLNGWLDTVLPNNPAAKPAKPAKKVEEDPAQRFGLAALQALSDAASEIRADRISLTSPAVGGELSGAATFNAAALYKLVANFGLSLRGLDRAAELVKPAPGQQQDETARNIAMVLGMLQAMGQQAKDDQGRDIRNYKLDVAADGKLLLNGADLTALIQASQGGAQPAAPAKPPKAPGKKQ